MQPIHVVCKAFHNLGSYTTSGSSPNSLGLTHQPHSSLSALDSPIYLQHHGPCKSSSWCLAIHSQSSPLAHFSICVGAPLPMLILTHSTFLASLTLVTKGSSYKFICIVTFFPTMKHKIELTMLLNSGYLWFVPDSSFFYFDTIFFYSFPSPPISPLL